MAQKIVTHLIDDIDGGEATETIVFGYKGKSYEIDLSEKNRDSLDKAMKKFVEHARTIGGSKQRGGSASKSQAQTGSDHKKRLADIRAWARENGHEVSERGRISGELIAAYDAANA